MWKVAPAPRPWAVSPAEALGVMPSRAGPTAPNTYRYSMRQLENYVCLGPAPEVEVTWEEEDDGQTQGPGTPFRPVAGFPDALHTRFPWTAPGRCKFRKSSKGT